MGLRFRKSIKIAPGVKMNLGKRGISSISAGGFNFGKRGINHTIGIPGTGISYRYKVGGRSNRKTKAVSVKKKSKSSNKQSYTKTSVQFALRSDGHVMCLDKKGRALSEALTKEAKKQNRDSIANWLDKQARNYNSEVKALVNMHLDTPAPEGDVVINRQPTPPKIKKYGLISKIFPKYHQRIERYNEKALMIYEEEMHKWETAENALRTDIDLMGDILSAAVNSIEWPRETLVSFDIVDSGHKVVVDIDLPEIEHMPTCEASINKAQLCLNIKDIAEKKQRLNYLQHIHAIAFRFIGEVFAHLPSVSEVILSGFSQRVSRKVAYTNDEYLYSFKVNRDLWRGINFSNLEELDVVQCFERFDIRRKITSTGIISPIKPFGSNRIKNISTK